MTETMSVREACKNVVRAIVDLSSLVIYSARSKNIYVNEVTLSTSKSLALPIFKASKEN